MGRERLYGAPTERLRRNVAVKLIADSLAGDRASVRRFRREAELCVRLAHPNIASVLDVSHRPRDYIVIAVDLHGAAPAEPAVGTPGYVAPEVIRGAGPSVQSDIYALGVVAYRLLGGPSPFPGSGRDSTAARTTAVAELPSLAAVRRDLAPSLTAIVTHAMSADPAERPASTAEPRAALLARVHPAP